MGNLWAIVIGIIWGILIVLAGIWLWSSLPNHDISIIIRAIFDSQIHAPILRPRTLIVSYIFLLLLIAFGFGTYVSVQQKLKSWEDIVIIGGVIFWINFIFIFSVVYVLDGVTGIHEAGGIIGLTLIIMVALTGAFIFVTCLGVVFANFIVEEPHHILPNTVLFTTVLLSMIIFWISGRSQSSLIPHEVPQFEQTITPITPLQTQSLTPLPNDNLSTEIIGLQPTLQSDSAPPNPGDNLDFLSDPRWDGIDAIVGIIAISITILGVLRQWTRRDRW